MLYTTKNYKKKRTKYSYEVLMPYKFLIILEFFESHFLRLRLLGNSNMSLI